MPRAPAEHGEPALFIVLNAAAEEIAFHMPKLPGYRLWQQVLDTTDIRQASAEFASGTEQRASPRSVAAFAGSPTALAGLP